MTNNPPAKGIKIPGQIGLSVRETLTILGLSKNGLKYHHGKGLIPWQNSHGAWVYDRDQVERLAAVLRSKLKPGPRPRRDLGTMAAEVFKLLDMGETLVEIVKILKVEPEQVAAWRAIWQTEANPVTVEPPLTAREQLARDSLDLKIVQEKNRVELARERLHERRRRDEE